MYTAIDGSIGFRNQPTRPSADRLKDGSFDLSYMFVRAGAVGSSGTDLLTRFVQEHFCD